MKKVFIIFSLMAILAVWFLVFNNPAEYMAEWRFKKYYNAMIDRNYEKAFEQLKLYEEGSYTDTKLSDEDALQNYLSKTNYLEQQNYQIDDIDIIEVEYEDAHSFWHHIEVHGQLDGKPFVAKEDAIVQDNKLMIGSSDDPFVQYRDGDMTVTVQ